MALDGFDLVLGRGEVGQALAEVLGRAFPVIEKDRHDPKESDIEIRFMHVCFPYSDAARFSEQVHRYRWAYRPRVTVIHSTVPVGTCRALGAVHSPVIGLHPDLPLHMRTFVKFIGDLDGMGSDVSIHFRAAGMRCYLFDDPETTELLKILSTTYYGLLIRYTQHVKALLSGWGVPFSAWTVWQDAYNRGYEKLDMREFWRPTLIPIRRPIGGHCVIPNLAFLDALADNGIDPFADLIRDESDLGEEFP